MWWYVNKILDTFRYVDVLEYDVTLIMILERLVMLMCLKLLMRLNAMNV